YMQEAAIAHRIALMTAGEIVALDTPDGLRSQVGEGLVHLDTEDNTKARQWLQEHEFRIQDMQQEGIFIISEQPQRVL
ncbi:MAG: hypothetical protein KDE58_41990, partial [Caldilineaceae bacterium]|nr:hypothetical protein [Caldilineaceae bacterium]